MKKHFFCQDCGREVARVKIKRCRSCFSKHQFKGVPRYEYARNWAMKKKYGIDSNDFDGYWMAQKGKCFICEKKLLMPTKTRGQGLDVVAIDHNHVTGKVRALLCNACNKALGLFKDDVSILRKALNYLLEEK